MCILTENVETLMRRRGITMTELSHAAGVSRVWLRDLKKGYARSAKVESVAKVAKALNVPVVALLTEGGVDQEALDFLTVWGELPSNRRADLLRMAEALRPPS